MHGAGLPTDMIRYHRIRTLLGCAGGGPPRRCGATHGTVTLNTVTQRRALRGEVVSHVFDLRWNCAQLIVRPCAPTPLPAAPLPRNRPLRPHTARSSTTGCSTRRRHTGDTASIAAIPTRGRHAEATASAGNPPLGRTCGAVTPPDRQSRQSGPPWQRTTSRHHKVSALGSWMRETSAGSALTAVPTLSAMSCTSGGMESGSPPSVHSNRTPHAMI